MTALPPDDTTANYAAQLEMLQNIERLGGSDGYESTPDSFADIAPALDPFKHELWTKSIRELDEHPKDKAAQSLKAKLQAELDLHHANPELALKKRVHGMIKGIESLGGAVGFEQCTQKANAKVKKTITANTTAWKDSSYAWGFAAGGLFITAVNLHTSDHEGTGHAWGPAFGIGNLQGTLYHDSYDANGFYFQNLAGVATAEFILDGTITGQFAGALIGLNLSLAFDGPWHW